MNYGKRVQRFKYSYKVIIMSKFKELSKKIQKQWKSKKSADAIAASIWIKKYGKAGMAKKAAAWRARKPVF